MDWKIVRDWLGDEVLTWPNNLPKHAPLPDSWATDSRNLKNSDWFVPIIGEVYNGHDFIVNAFDQGCSGCLCSKEFEEKIPKNFPAIVVKDTLRSFQLLAKGWLTQVNPRLVAITGSVGKTTVKSLALSIFEQEGLVHGAKGSFNNEIGVPKTILSMPAETKTCVLEYGARYPTNIKYLCELYPPDVGVVCNVFPVHLSEFKDLATILATKSEMFLFSKPDARLVCFHDQPELLANAVATGKKLLTFGENEKSTVKVHSYDWSASGINVVLRLPKMERIELHSAEAHEALPLNAACATAIGLASDIRLSQIQKGLETYQPAAGRFNILRMKNLIVVDDSYNASPQSMEAGIKSCAKLFPNQTKIAVLGDMLELGSQEKIQHREIGKVCSQVLKPDLLITIGTLAGNIAEGALEAGLAKDKILSFDGVDKAIRLPERIYTKRNLVFVKGSHGMHLNKLVEVLKIIGER